MAMDPNIIPEPDRYEQGPNDLKEYPVWDDIPSHETNTELTQGAVNRAVMDDPDILSEDSLIGDIDFSERTEETEEALQEKAEAARFALLTAIGENVETAYSNVTGVSLKELYRARQLAASILCFAKHLEAAVKSVVTSAINSHLPNDTVAISVTGDPANDMDDLLKMVLDKIKGSVQDRENTTPSDDADGLALLEGLFDLDSPEDIPDLEQG